MSYELLKPGRVVSFEVYPVATLGNNFKNVTVEAVQSAKIARMLGTDVDVLHAIVYPTLPEGTPNNPEDYNFLMVTTSSGETKFVGLPWIKETSIKTEESGVAEILVPNIGPEDLEPMRLALVSIGYPPNSIRIK